MKFSVLQENLAYGLMVVSHLASKNNSLPILNSILVSVDENGIVLSATNLEIGVRITIRGKVDEPGSLALPAKTFSEFVSLAPVGKIVCHQEEMTLNIETPNTKTAIRGQSAEEFPLIPTIDNVEPMALPAQEFRAAISQTVFAVAQDESRPEISGVYFVIDDNTCILVATDSYRLAERVITLPVKAKQGHMVIIPSRTIQELIRSIGDDEASVAIKLNDNQALFSFSGVEIVSRLIDGQYPDYKQIIPSSTTISATVSVEPLVKAIKTAGLFSKTGVNDITLSIHAKGIKITSTNSQLGEYESSVPAETSGGELSVVFNHRYLLDGLANIGAANITFSFVDQKSPGVIAPQDKKSGYTYIIMPITQ